MLAPRFGTAYPYGVASEEAQTYRPVLWSREEWLEVVRRHTRSTEARFVAYVLSSHVAAVMHWAWVSRDLTTAKVAKLTGIDSCKVTRAVGRLKRLGLVGGVSGEWHLGYDVVFEDVEEEEV